MNPAEQVTGEPRTMVARPGCWPEPCVPSHRLYKGLSIPSCYACGEIGWDEMLIDRAERDAEVRADERVRVMAELAAQQRRYAECHEGVTRRGEFQPCDRTAVGMALDPEDGGPYPVCQQHVRGRGIPLAEVLARHETEIRAKVAAKIRAIRGALTDDGWTELAERAEAAGSTISADLIRDFRDADEYVSAAIDAAYELGRDHAVRVAEGGDRD